MSAWAEIFCGSENVSSTDPVFSRTEERCTRDSTNPAVWNGMIDSYMFCFGRDGDASRFDNGMVNMCDWFNDQSATRITGANATAIMPLDGHGHSWKSDHSPTFLMRSNDQDDDCGSTVKSAHSRSAIRSVLTKNFLFSTIIGKDLEEVIDRMVKRTVPRHKKVLEQGDPVGSFFIVQSGKLNIFVDGQKLASYYTNDSFGEEALLPSSEATSMARATVVATSKTKLWVLSSSQAKQILSQNAARRNTEIATLLRSVPIFKALHQERLNKIANIVIISSYTTGEVICKKGEPGSSLYIIQSGSVQVQTGDETKSPAISRGRARSRYFPKLLHFYSKGSPLLPTLRPGDYFGENALVTGEVRNATVTASQPLTVLKIERDKYEPVLGPIRRLLDESFVLQALNKTGLFERLSAEQCAKVASCFRERRYKKGQRIVAEGEKGCSFFVIKIGSCEVLKTLESSTSTGENSQDRLRARLKRSPLSRASRQGTVAKLTAGNFFGEQSLVTDEKRSATVIAAADGTICCVIERRDLLDALQCDQKTLITAFSAIAHRRRIGDFASAKLKLADFKVIGLLGVSPFSSIKLVTSALRPNEVFALKIIHKSRIVKQNQQKHILNEKRILATLRHPNIVHFWTSFKDYYCLYLVMDFVPGGELHSLIHPKKGSTRLNLFEEEAQFYSGCVVLALEHMHDLNIAYRDLKPENLLLDERGYIKIVDFGLASIIHDKSYTFCGTPEYLAPEMIHGIGHTKAVDLWALGVLIYEMIAAQTPFVVDGNSHSDSNTAICNRIVNRLFDFTAEFQSIGACCNLINKLLEPNPAKRLGCLTKEHVHELRRDLWYSTLDFDALYAGSLPSPWKPTLNGTDDASHYDTSGLADLTIDRSYKQQVTDTWDESF